MFEVIDEPADHPHEFEYSLPLETEEASEDCVDYQAAPSTAFAVSREGSEETCLDSQTDSAVLLKSLSDFFCKESLRRNDENNEDEENSCCSDSDSNSESGKETSLIYRFSQG